MPPHLCHNQGGHTHHTSAGGMSIIDTIFEGGSKGLESHMCLHKEQSSAPKLSLNLNRLTREHCTCLAWSRWHIQICGTEADSHGKEGILCHASHPGQQLGGGHPLRILTHPTVSQKNPTGSFHDPSGSCMNRDQRGSQRAELAAVE